MNQVVIENPIINSPFEEPMRHFRFTEDGITNEIIEERRTSSYFIPIPKPKKKAVEKKNNMEAKVATARTLWVPAVNNNSDYGRWAFLEIRDPWNAMNAIREILKDCG
jgi:hypothetical protein